MSIDQMKKRAKNFSRHLDAHLKRFENPTSATASLEFVAKLEGYPSWHAALERLQVRTPMDSSIPATPVLPISFGASRYCGSHLRIMSEALDSGCGMIIVGGNSGWDDTAHDFVTTLNTLKNSNRTVFVASHESVLRESYRQSWNRSVPDATILVDEVSDTADAKFASECAMAGRLVCFPVHSAGMPGMIARLTTSEIGMRRNDLTLVRVLNLLIYQRNVRPLCRHCMLSTREALQQDASSDVANACSYVNDTLHLSVESLKWENPTGCPVCRKDSAHANRAAAMLVAEMYRPDHEWLERTRNGDDEGAYAHFRSFSDGDLLSEDMRGKTILEHALRRAFSGEIDIRECRKVGSLQF